MAAIGEKPFRAKQLWHWIYHQGETDFARMTTIAKPMQAKLAERFAVGRPGVAAGAEIFANCEPSLATSSGNSERRAASGSHRRTS